MPESTALLTGGASWAHLYLLIMQWTLALHKVLVSCHNSGCSTSHLHKASASLKCYAAVVKLQQMHALQRSPDRHEVCEHMPVGLADSLGRS